VPGQGLTGTERGFPNLFFETMTTNSDKKPRRISVQALEKFCASALAKAGVSPAHARTTTEILVTTDTFGVYTHGVNSLRGYIRRVKGGGLRTDSSPEIVQQGPSWALIDGHSSIAMVTSSFAMNVAIEKARASGIGYAGVRNNCHFGAAGLYALQAARADMVGLAMCNDKPSVSVPGSRDMVLGTNPFAYAVPAGRGRPIFMDIATSAAAGGKVWQAKALGKKLPEGWVTDKDGLPTTDPTGWPAVGALMPMAGHKGYGIAFMIEVISAVMTGAALTNQVRSWMLDDVSLPTLHGAAFIAFNVGAMIPIASFKERIDGLADEIHRARLAKGAERIYLPGEMEWERRDKALKEGIPLPSTVVDSLILLAGELQIPPPAFSADQA